MDQTGDLTAIFRLHRHNVTAVTGGDDGFLQCLLVGRRRNNLLQRISGTGRSRTNLAANGCQFGTCSIGNFVFPNDGGGDFLFQMVYGTQGRKQVIQHGAFRQAAVMLPIGADIARAGQHLCNGQQLGGVQHTAQIRTRQAVSHILNAVKAGTALEHHHLLCRSGFSQTAAHHALFADRAQLQTVLLCCFAHSLCSQHLQHSRQFQCM